MLNPLGVKNVSFGTFKVMSSKEKLEKLIAGLKERGRDNEFSISDKPSKLIADPRHHYFILMTAKVDGREPYSPENKLKALELEAEYLNEVVPGGRTRKQELRREGYEIKTDIEHWKITAPIAIELENKKQAKSAQRDRLNAAL